MPDVGGYVWGDSPLHRMPAAPKLVLLVVAMALCAMAQGAAGLIACALAVAAVVRLSRVGWRRALALVWGLRWFLAAVLAMNAAFFSATEPLLSLGPVTVTRAGVWQGVLVDARVCLVVALGSLLTATTRPQELVEGVRTLLLPLARLGVNTEVAALAVGITVQFVPTLMRESRQLVQAQEARGGGAASGSMLSRARGLVRLLVPIFVSAFRRADELSLAMEARGYSLGRKPARACGSKRQKR